MASDCQKQIQYAKISVSVGKNIPVASQFSCGGVRVSEQFRYQFLCSIWALENYQKIFSFRIDKMNK